MWPVNTLHADRCNPCTPAQVRKFGVVVHDSESSDGSHDSLVRFLQGPKVALPNGTYNVAGYHAVTDGRGGYTQVADGTLGPFHAPPTNYTWWAVCMPGAAAQTRDQWLDALSRNHIRGVARFIVDRWHEDKHSWPLEMRPVADLMAGSHGYTSHNNVSRAWGKTTHTDPGGSFPWDVLASDIGELVEPPPDPEEDDMQLTVYKLTDDPACFVAVATKAGAAVQVEWIEKAEDLAAFEARPDVVVNKSFTKATLRTCSLFGKLPPGWSAADFRHVGG